MFKKIAVYDMDGTIVDSLHRYQTINNKIDLAHWRYNSHLAAEDGLLPLADQYRKDLFNPAIFVIIATARELGIEDHIYITEKLGRPDHFIGRPRGSNIGGSALKIEGIEQLMLDMPCLRGLDMVVYEDNHSYLEDIGQHFGAEQVFIQSEQGH